MKSSVLLTGNILLLGVSNLFAAALYVSLESSNPTPPYTNWATAAATIQAAVDAAAPGDEIVVTNGVYAAGGRAVGTNVLVNRVAVDKALTLRSVNGPQATFIQGVKVAGGYIGCGDGANRCVSLADGACLLGFTLTNGATRTEGDSQLEQSGGGVWCESPSVLVSNCVLTGNSAWYGGGAYGGTLYDCALTNNTARYSGGGAYAGLLNICVLTRNSARYADGGGAYGSTLNDCNLASNVVENAGGGGASDSTLNHCALTGNSSTFAGGGASYSTLNLCALTNNSAWSFGGGAYGGTLTNCNLIGNSAGSGGGAYASTLNQCTLTANRATSTNMWSGGGGAYGGTLLNCTLNNNSAWSGGGAASDYGNTDVGLLDNCLLTGNSAQLGGGAVDCRLNNCVLTGNSATNYGGGAYAGWLYNCTLTGNSAGSGGGASQCWSDNCIAYFNTAVLSGANYDPDSPYSPLNFCCTTPLPTNGAGNITVPPHFVDYANGDLHLQSNSPCINAGNNAYVTATDLDGNPRIISGTVDLGAYEFQGSGSRISYAWLQQYGLPTDGSADFADEEPDGMNNWQEWICRTDPRDPLSALRLLSAAPAGSSVTVSWQSVAGVKYFLERRPSLGSPFALLATNIIGQAGTTAYTDTTAAGSGPFFYRVGVRGP